MPNSQTLYLPAEDLHPPIMPTVPKKAQCVEWPATCYLTKKSNCGATVSASQLGGTEFTDKNSLQGGDQ